MPIKVSSPKDAEDKAATTYDVTFPGKNLGIKFRRQGEKLIVRKLNNDEGEEPNDLVKLGE
jgi:hypothetical protein